MFNSNEKKSYLILACTQSMQSRVAIVMCAAEMLIACVSIPDTKTSGGFPEKLGFIHKWPFCFSTGLYIILPALLCPLQPLPVSNYLFSVLICKICDFKCFMSIKKKQKNCILLCMVHGIESRETAGYSWEKPLTKESRSLIL